MPRGDGTGPMGMGPMTGRGAGFCAGYGAPGYANAGWGPARGFGRGFGRGRGFGWWRRGGPAPGVVPGAPGYARANPWGAWEISREEELEYLKGQAGALKEELDAITRRVGQLESESEEEQ